jgi:branched-chain amino acid transport system permease protein
MTMSSLRTPLLLLALGVIVLIPVDLTGLGIPWSGLKRYGIYILSLWMVTAIAAMGVNLIMGYAGQETLAQAAFLGIGAYTTAILTKAGIPFGAAFLLSGLLSFVIGIGLGFPALRVQKHYLAFVTLAFTVAVWLVIRNEEWLTGGVSGIQDIPRPSLLGFSLKPALYYYWFVLAVTALLAFVLWWIIRSPWGRAFTALRENAIRAESLGIDVRGYKLLAFAIGSAYGGFAGSLYAPLVEFIDPNPFALAPSLMYLLMVMLGGMGTFIGPFIGAAIAVMMPEQLQIWQAKFEAAYPGMHLPSYLIIFAVLVMVMVALCPTGIVGLFERIFTRKRRPHADDKGPVLGEVKS